MSNQDGNVCIRCGKPRIVVKTWEEHVKESVLVYTTTACSDPACQKIVDKQLAAQKEKKITVEKERKERVEAARKTAQERAVKA